jgi:hypothetical protein
VLPGSILIKKGRSKNRPGRDIGYFKNDAELGPLLTKCRRKYTHLVVETNLQGPSRRRAVRIFLDVRPGAAGIRRDTARLRQNADICIGNGESAEQWREVLEGQLDNAVLIDLVLDILDVQEKYNTD